MHPMAFDVKLYNVVLLGLAFMLIFTAFQTTSIIEVVVIKSIKGFDASGYTSLSIIYGVLAIANWAAPSVVSVLGAKYSMIAGAITYSIFIASFLYPRIWLLYLASALVGFGAACIWTGQGNFLTVNSNLDTIGRNSGIFWAMLQSSLLIGNLFVYIKFHGAKTLDESIIRDVFIVLLVVGCIGFVVLFFLRSRSSSSEVGISSSSNTTASGPVQALKQSLSLFITPNMLLLSTTFFYTGVELGFFSGVYSASIGFTEQLGSQRTQLMGMSGMFIGAGEIIGGAAFGLMGRKTNRYGRDPIVVLGYVIHMVAFFLIFLNIPFNAPLGDTNSYACIHSNAYIAILCSFLMGLGDSCFNTQIYSILGAMYPDDSAPAFALFKFIQSLGAAAIFVYSLVLPLHWHIAILIILGTFGMYTFCIVEWRVYNEYNEKLSKTKNMEINDELKS